MVQIKKLALAATGIIVFLGTHQVGTNSAAAGRAQELRTTAKISAPIKIADATTAPATRDKWQWPFAANSIWNMPIGSNAAYTPANLQNAGYLGVDLEYLYKLKAGDPMHPVYSPGSFGPGRCKGTEYMGVSLPFPDSLVVPDATSNETPNNASAFLMPDGKTIEQFEPLARCMPKGRVYGWRNPWGGVDIFGDGIKGTHFGSGLSALGGSIRLGELTNDQPIRHAIKIIVWAKKYLHYSSSIPGYRWPADRADNYAASEYGGTDPKLVQGSLLAIPPSITEESLGLQTAAAKKLFRALQDYGAYIVDDAYWDAHYFAMQKGVPEEVRSKYGHDVVGNSGSFYDDAMKLFKALSIVDNNAPDNIGGGGTPRAPLAPPFKK